MAKHIEVSLTELISREDEKLGRYNEDKERGAEGAAGLVAQTIARMKELEDRRERRRAEMARQRHLTLQGVERITSVLVLPHPDRESSLRSAIFTKTKRWKKSRWLSL